jgi:sugar phosphate permease
MSQTLARLHYAWVMAALTFLVLLVVAGLRATPGILMLPLETDFGWPKADISFAVAVNLLLYGLLGPFAVAVIDRYGVRRILVFALLLIAVGTGLAPLMQSKWHFTLLWGLVVGTGSGTVSMALAALVANRWFAARRGIVVGMLTASAAGGQLLFLPLLAWIVEAAGWQAVMLVMCAAILALLPLVLWGMRDHPSDIGLAPYGDPGAPRRPVRVHGNPFANALRALAEGLRDRNFLLIAGSFFICGATTLGLIGTHLVPACADAGIAPMVGAGLLAGMAVFNVAGALSSGWLSDRVDTRILLAVYYSLRGLSLLYLPYSFDSPTGLFLFAVFYGLDWIATVPPTVKLCASTFGKERGALIYGWVTAAHQVGSGVAAFAGGLLRDHLGSYALVFFLGGAACGIAALMALSVGRRPVEARPVHATG